MTKTNTYLIDASVAAGLGLALLLVIGIDKIMPAAVESEQVPTIVMSTPPETARERPLRLAVTPTQSDLKNGKWDDMGKLLDSLGEGYRFDMLPLADLLDLQKLAEYDVLFLTCARGGTEKAITDNLRAFVGKGGTLYASDWRYDCVAQAFPDFQAPGLMGQGQEQNVLANVLDPGLRDILGPTVPLLFNLSHWKTAAFGGNRVTKLIEGDYLKLKQFGGARATAPLLVKFQFGKGTVIFTSFHNERQNSAVEQKLLKYLVFSAVTAKVEAQVAQTMMTGGFSPQKTSLFGVSPKNPEVRQTYRSKKGGKIRFVLGFENRGARLRLTVIPPQGQRIQQEGSSTFTIEVPNAPIGDWEYIVTPLYVPYSDFPFSLMVGEST